MTSWTWSCLRFRRTLISWFWRRHGQEALVLSRRTPTANTFFVTVVADNAKSITAYVHYELTRENGFDNVRLDDKPPADAEFMQPLGIMQQLQQRLRAHSEEADETPESKE
jgi:hypothetical protein